MLKKLREPGSAITHFIGVLFSAAVATPLIMRAAQTSVRNAAAMTIFAFSMLLLYSASTTYHSIRFSAAVIKVFRKIDHMMIFILIAGSYTPVCLIVLKGTVGTAMLCAVWGIAAAGILFKALWITCPKWVSSVLYIGMGWTCVFAFVPLWNILSAAAFAWLLAGGVFYTVGGVIYACKLSLLNSRHANFGSHEIFHLFVLAGSFCHFIFMYVFVANM
ncbi:MAG TPA: hemolysin III family protein [Lachnospiraceae bacterium]|nr:hemolysin III family protein [Lachnospiraceae bacterium]